MAKNRRTLTNAAFSDLKRWSDDDYAKYATETAEVMLDTLFRQQRDFVLDAHRYKSMLCPRGAGKSHSIGTLLLRKCLLQARSNCFFVALTLKAAKRIIWDHLKQLDTEYELGCKFQNTDFICTVPNGSTITLTGAETASDVDKLRGIPLDLVVVDETASFAPSHIDYFIHQAIGPRLNDRFGSLILSGTPGHLLKGEFFESTSDSKIARPWERHAGWTQTFTWSFHHWTLQDNIAVPHLWDEALKTKERRQWSDDNPIWVREYLGRWIADDSSLVYHYNWGSDGDGRNDWTRLPDQDTDNPWGLPEGQEWKFILGADFGYEDAFAIQVGAYSETQPYLYQVYEFCSPKLVVSEMAEELQRAIDIFGDFEAMVGDQGGLAKTVIETLSAEYGIHLDPAEKKEKGDYIELLNADLFEGKIKILPTSRLAHEWQFLVWAPDKGRTRRVEDRRCENHNADAFLYLWRNSFHRAWATKEGRPLPGTPDYFREREKQEINEMIERRRKRNVLDHVDAQEMAKLDSVDVSWGDDYLEYVE